MGVLFVNYHKTGAALVLELMHLLQNKFNLSTYHMAPQYRQHCTTTPIAQLEACRANIVRWSAPELVCSHGAIPACYQAVVHYVRDPASWAISAYDFHRQTPTPETWAMQRLDVCSRSHTGLYTAAGLGFSPAALAAADAACAALSDTTRSLHAQLQSLSEFDGLRLMTFFGIFGGATLPPASFGGGDLVRMAVNALIFRDDHSGVAAIGDLVRKAANALFHRRPNPGQGAISGDAQSRAVLNIWADDVISKPEAAMRELATFLVGAYPRAAKSGGGPSTSAPSQQPFATLDAATLASYLTDAHVSRYKALQQVDSNHITSSSAPSAIARKLNLSRALSDDLVIGPLIRRLRHVFACAATTAPEPASCRASLGPTTTPPLSEAGPRVGLSSATPSAAPATPSATALASAALASLPLPAAASSASMGGECSAGSGQRRRPALCEFERLTGSIAGRVGGSIAVRTMGGLDAEGSLPQLMASLLRGCTDHYCAHSHGHALGRALSMLTAQGNDLDSSLSAIALCGTSFQLGCFHGAVQGIVMRMPALEPGDM